MSNSNPSPSTRFGQGQPGTRFAKGQSGNPGGRPKGTTKLAKAPEVIAKEKLVKVLEEIPKEELIKLILDRISKGDLLDVLVKALTEPVPKRQKLKVRG